MPTQIAPIGSKTSNGNQSSVLNRTTSPSASELSSDDESETDLFSNQISSIASTQNQQRKLSERIPRESSTTSTEETLLGAIGNDNVVIDNENESEPFSQVFINRTKQRMDKKKQKTSEDITKALWV